MPGWPRCQDTALLGGGECWGQQGDSPALCCETFATQGSRGLHAPTSHVLSYKVPESCRAEECSCSPSLPHLPVSTSVTADARQRSPSTVQDRRRGHGQGQPEPLHLPLEAGSEVGAASTELLPGRCTHSHAEAAAPLCSRSTAPSHRWPCAGQPPPAHAIPCHALTPAIRAPFRVPPGLGEGTQRLLHWRSWQSAERPKKPSFHGPRGCGLCSRFVTARPTRCPMARLGVNVGQEKPDVASKRSSGQDLPSEQLSVSKRPKGSKNTRGAELWGPGAAGPALSSCHQHITGNWGEGQGEVSGAGSPWSGCAQGAAASHLASVSPDAQGSSPAEQDKTRNFPACLKSWFIIRLSHIFHSSKFRACY